MTQIRCSVIIPFHKELDLINTAVQSVLKQQGIEDVRVEIIIVNDGEVPNDLIIQEIEPLGTCDIAVLCNEAEKGPGGARNTGLDHAQGKYVFFLDADDEWHVAKLAKQLSLLNSGRTFVCSGYCVEGTTNIIKPKFPPSTVFELAICDGIGTSTVGLSVDLIGAERFGNLDKAQDLEFWLRLAARANFKFASVDEHLVTYRPSGRTRNKLVQAYFVYKALVGKRLSLTQRLIIIVMRTLNSVHRLRWLKIGVTRFDCDNA